MRIAYLMLAFDVSTHPALDTTYGGFSFNPYHFVVFDSNTIRVNDPVGNACSCLNTTETLPPGDGPERVRLREHPLRRPDRHWVDRVPAY